MMLDKKANSSDFLFKFKWVVKQQRQLTTVHLAQELLMNLQSNDGLRSVAKEERALKMRSAGASHQKLTTTNWEPSLKLILLQIHEKLPRNSTSTIPMVIQHLKHIGKARKLGKWVPHALPTKSKTTVLKYCLLLFYATTNHFSRLWHDEKCILYDNQWWPAQWLD